MNLFRRLFGHGDRTPEPTILDTHSSRIDQDIIESRRARQEMKSTLQQTREITRDSIRRIEAFPTLEQLMADDRGPYRG